MMNVIQVSQSSIDCIIVDNGRFRQKMTKLLSDERSVKSSGINVYKPTNKSFIG